ncbi:MAG: ATP-binding cassette domain-containing protein [Symbiobacteriaceae bacterium]|nr:ATP-binding cassette domain-containing protein [Symbiobacteriaceae bacterium]
MSIHVSGLSKSYRTRVKGEGVLASLKALLNPEYRQITAVDNISFEVNPGELLAFIGPNGAGKSTTIKMLTGILHPSWGDIRVLGLNPSREREKLAQKIGTVFGQRSQLWLHLPPSDSYALLARIYDLEEKAFRYRLAELTELFDLAELMKVPVRKLSLGQRIRCEIVGSLLHRPQIIFLDEPTIGLDVLVKQTIRDLIARLNREEGTTIFLTSHDAGDVEQLCQRALVIDKGEIIMDDQVAEIRRRFLNRKVIELSYAEGINFPTPANVQRQDLDHGRIQLTVDTRMIEVGELLQQLVAYGVLKDVTVSDPPMEEIIAAIFRHQKEVAL